MKYYFPICNILPGDGIDEVKIDDIYIVTRKWDVTFFDLATLGAKHNLKIPYELLNIYFKTCNIELCLDANSLEHACKKYRCIRSILYANGLSPYISPCVMNYSLNQISGINTRDSDILKSDHEELNVGINSKDAKIEIYPIDLILKIHGTKKQNSDLLTKHIFINSAWRSLCVIDKYDNIPEFKNVIDGLIACPKIEFTSQSLLHIWTIIESLFPSVQSELSFRLALYISHILYGKRRELFERVKKAYKVRCRVSHGSAKDVSYEEWVDAWDILCLISSAIIYQGHAPTEEMIIDKIFEERRML